MDRELFVRAIDRRSARTGRWSGGGGAAPGAA
jgi:hypothetical protein